MTVSVRPWPEIAADLRDLDITTIVKRWNLRIEAAVAGDALAAEVEVLRTSRDNWHALVDRIHENEDALLHSVGIADIESLTAVVAAVHTALDHYERDRTALTVYSCAATCVSAIAEAVER